MRNRIAAVAMIVLCFNYSVIADTTAPGQAGPALYPALQKKLVAEQAENTKLKADLKSANDALAQAEQKIIVLQRQLADAQQAAQAQTAGDAKIDAAKPDPAAFRRFADRLFGEISKSHSRDAKGKTVNGIENQNTNIVRLISIDLKKSDSVLTPYTGELVWTEFTSVIHSDPSNIVTLTRTYRYTAVLTPEAGKWAIASVSETVEDDSLKPEPPTWHSKAGQTSTVPASSLQEELKTAQG